MDGHAATTGARRLEGPPRKEGGRVGPKTKERAGVPVALTKIHPAVAMGPRQ